MADADKEAEILHWAEKLFYPVSLKGKTPKEDPTSRNLGKTAVKMLSSHARVRAQIARTTRRSPEVMVKITNRLGAGKGMVAIRNHLSYISRNGKLELETDTGERLSGRDAIADYSEELKCQIRGIPIPEVSNRREAFNIILSMPAGTPSDKVHEAASHFLKDEFCDRHRYCFTLHTDTDKPHVHACVLAAPLRKGKRLNPRKADLQRWREGFAEQLRNIGIDANATPRKTRGESRNPISQSGHHIRRKMPIHFSKIDAFVEWPEVYRSAQDAWRKLAKSMQHSSSEAELKIATEIERFVTVRDPDNQKKR